MNVAMNTDEMKYEELVGMLQSEEMETTQEKSTGAKSVAFAVEAERDKFQELKNSMALMARNFGKALKQVEKGQNITSNRFQRSDGDRLGHRSFKKNEDKGGKRRELQCYECERFGHLKLECPLAKRKELKCYECKGIRHTY